jgi:hypothetical protein
MSHTPRESPAELHPPAPRPLATLAVTAALLAGVLGAMVAVSYPAAAVAVATLVVTATGVARVVHRRTRNASDRRRVCIPHTGVCVRL